jgi:sugar phosphate isomerase/epimerase
MKTIKGPGIFLAQFARDTVPFNSLKGLAGWVSGLGYKGVQIPSWDSRLIDLEKAAESKTYADDILGVLAEHNLELIEIGSYLQGQCLAFHPAYAAGFSAFHPPGLSGTAVTEWASDQLMKSVKASVHLGTSNISVMSGGFAWHMIYPWPQRPPGLVDEAFIELSRRWLPILDFARDNGVTFGYELHPGSDLYDGATFERFLDKTGEHPAACLTYDPSHFLLQQLDYIEFIRLYHERIRAFHVKDAEFRPDGRVGVYGGYENWADRAGRFRSLGDGQVDFHRIFSLLTSCGYDGWAILEWECCIKSPEQGAREGAPFIKSRIIEATDVAFDDFAGTGTDRTLLRRMLGLE